MVEVGQDISLSLRLDLPAIAAAASVGGRTLKAEILVKVLPAGGLKKTAEVIVEVDCASLKKAWVDDAHPAENSASPLRIKGAFAFADANNLFSCPIAIRSSAGRRTWPPSPACMPRPPSRSASIRRPSTRTDGRIRALPEPPGTHEPLRGRQAPERRRLPQDEELLGFFKDAIATHKEYSALKMGSFAMLSAGRFQAGRAEDLELHGEIGKAIAR